MSNTIGLQLQLQIGTLCWAGSVTAKPQWLVIIIIRPERSVTWGDRPNKDRPFEKNVPQYRYQQQRGLLRPLFTFHYCTVAAVSATSDTARLLCYRYLPTTARSVMDLWLSQVRVNPGHGPGARHDRV